MQPLDFFRSRIDAMINLNDPLAVLASRLPWDQIEASVAAKFERQERAGQMLVRWRLPTRLSPRNCLAWAYPPALRCAMAFSCTVVSTITRARGLWA